MMHEYVFICKARQPQEAKPFLSSMFTKEATNTREAKAQVLAMAKRKYPGLVISIELQSVDAQVPLHTYAWINQVTRRKHAVRAMGAPSKRIQGVTDWEKFMLRRPDLLRFARFAEINPKKLILEVYIGDEASSTVFDLGQLKWNAMSDNVTGLDKGGQQVFKWQLIKLPSWAKKIKVTWFTAEMYRVKDKYLTRDYVRALNFNLQSDVSTAPKATLPKAAPIWVETPAASTRVVEAIAKAPQKEVQAITPRQIQGTSTVSELPPPPLMPSFQASAAEEEEQGGRVITGVGASGKEEQVEAVRDQITKLIAVIERINHKYNLGFEWPRDADFTKYKQRWQDEFGFDEDEPFSVNKRELLYVLGERKKKIEMLRESKAGERERIGQH